MSSNDQLVVILSPSGDTDAIVMAVAHLESRRMIVCNQNVDNE